MLLHEFSIFIEVSLFVNLFLGGATTVIGFVVKYVSVYVLASLVSQALGRFKIDQVIKYFYRVPIALALVQAIIVVFLGWGV
jgi:NADH-quinone oxidoreductase subunit H